MAVIILTIITLMVVMYCFEKFNGLQSKFVNTKKALTSEIYIFTSEYIFIYIYKCEYIYNIYIYLLVNIYIYTI